MLYRFLAILAFLSVLNYVQAFPVSGRVTDSNGKGVAGIPVSDGISIVRSGIDGSYKLECRDGQKFIFIQNPDEQYCEHWFHREPVPGRKYDFVLQPRPAGKVRSFLQVADTEQKGIVWAKPLYKFTPDFLIHSGDTCGRDGVITHGKELTFREMGFPVYFSIGNHDILKNEDDLYLYAQYVQPYWFSFLWNGYLMISAPMWVGDGKMPYEMEDFGEWLKNLLTIYPDMPVIVLSHDLVRSKAANMYFPARNGEKVDLSKRAKYWLIGHFHYNLSLPLNGNCHLFCTAQPHRGGIDHSPRAFRELIANPDGTLESRLHWGTPASKIFLTIPGSGWKVKNNGLDRISATVWSDGLPVVGVKAFAGDREITLRQKGFSWEADAALSDKTDKVTLQATLRNGEKITEEFALDTPSQSLQLLWQSSMDTEALFTAPLIAEGKLFTAGIDDHNNRNGAIYAWDADSGKLLWKFITRYSVRNDMAYADGILYAQDSYGNIYALRTGDGSIFWQFSDSAPSLEPISNGLCFSEGVIYAGLKDKLAAYDARTGRELWRNKEWTRGCSSVGNNQIFGDTLIAAANWYGICAHNRTSGKLLWFSGTSSTRWVAAPALQDGDTIICKGHYELNRVNLKSGEILQSVKMPDSIQTASGILAVGDNLYMGGQQSFLCVDRKTFEVKWHFKGVKTALVDTVPYVMRGKSVECSPVLYNGLIWFGANDGFLYALNPGNGSLVESCAIGSPVIAELTVSDGKLYAVDFSGRIFCFKHK